MFLYYTEVRWLSRGTALRGVFPLRKSRIAEIIFVDSPTLQYPNFDHTSFGFVDRQSGVLLSEGQSSYFEEISWVMSMCPFTDGYTENEMLIDLRSDMHQKITFTTMKYYDF